MRFNKNGCMAFLVGFFVLGNGIIALLEGNMSKIVNGIIGMGLAIAFGFFVGREK